LGSTAIIGSSLDEVGVEAGVAGEFGVEGDRQQAAYAGGHGGAVGEARDESRGAEENPGEGFLISFGYPGDPEAFLEAVDLAAEVWPATTKSLSAWTAAADVRTTDSFYGRGPSNPIPFAWIRSTAYQPFHNCLYVVLPAEAGIQGLSGYRFTSGMTVLFRDD